MKRRSWGKRRGEEGKENGAKIFKFRTPEAWRGGGGGGLQGSGQRTIYSINPKKQ